MFHPRSNSYSYSHLSRPSSEIGTSTPDLRSDLPINQTRQSGPITGTGYVPHRQYRYRNSLVLPNRPTSFQLLTSQPNENTDYNAPSHSIANTANSVATSEPNPHRDHSASTYRHTSNLPTFEFPEPEPETRSFSPRSDISQAHSHSNDSSGVKLPTSALREGSLQPQSSPQDITRHLSYQAPTPPVTQRTYSQVTPGIRSGSALLGSGWNTPPAEQELHLNVSHTVVGTSVHDHPSSSATWAPPIPWSTKPRRNTTCFSDFRPSPLPPAGGYESPALGIGTFYNNGRGVPSQNQQPRLAHKEPFVSSDIAQMNRLSITSKPNNRSQLLEHPSVPPPLIPGNRASVARTNSGDSFTSACSFSPTPPLKSNRTIYPSREANSSPTEGGVSLTSNSFSEYAPLFTSRPKSGVQASNPSLIGQLPLPPPPPPRHLRTMSYNSTHDYIHSPRFSSSLSSTPEILSTPDIKLDGQPNEFITTCPKAEPLQFKTYSYRLRGAQDFPICSSCYYKYVRGSRFAHEFTRDLESRQGSICLFNVPRIINIFWPNALATGSLQYFAEYLTRRIKIKNCKQRQPAINQDGIKWYSPISGNPEGFVVCEACYQDKMVGTGLEGNLRVHPEPHPLDQAWVCALALDYFCRAIPIYARTNSWPYFASTVAHRLSLKPCTPDPVVMTTKTWHRPKRPTSSFLICEACYRDNIDITDYSSNFEIVPSSEFPYGSTIMGRCQFSKLPVQMAWSQVMELESTDMWWRTINAIANSPDCVPEGFHSGIWYTLDESTTNFDICPACYSGVLAIHGIGRFFQRANRDPKVARACDLNPRGPRFLKLLNILLEAIQLGVFESVHSFITRFSPAPPCPRTSPVEGHKWYGIEDSFLMCQECFEELGRNSTLESQLIVTGQHRLEPQSCELYSPRMREIWEQACRDQSLESFLPLARERRRVYESLMPAMIQLQKSQQQALDTAHMMHQINPFPNSSNGLLTRPNSGIQMSIHSSGPDNWTAGEPFWTREGVLSGRLKACGKDISSGDFQEDNNRLRELENVWTEFE